MSVVAVLPAERFSAGEFEQSLLVNSVRALLDAGVATVLIAMSDRVTVADLAARHGLPPDTVRVIAGGAAPDPEDPEGTARALARDAASACPVGSTDVVLVHDPRRALTPPFVIAAVVDAVRSGAGAAVAALPATDTVKRVGADGMVAGTVDRASLKAVHGPRAYAVAALRDGAERTPPRIVPGHARAMRITTPADLAVAESITAEEPL